LATVYAHDRVVDVATHRSNRLVRRVAMTTYTFTLFDVNIDVI